MEKMRQQVFTYFKNDLYSTYTLVKSHVTNDFWFHYIHGNVAE
jgi:hypothetical protein